MVEPARSDAVTIFQQEPNGVTYRIPALLRIEDPPVFLAFAEKRSSPRDQDALYLVMRRGVEKHGTIHWEKMIAVRHAKLSGHRTMNPCPLYDTKTKTVFLFFVCIRTDCSEWTQIFRGRNAARLCYVSSSDHGQSWSSLVDVTQSILGKDLKNCATLAVGPGHGIQSSSGQLIVPAYLYYIHSRFCGLPIPWKTKPHSFVFYSDDHGKTWQRGSTLWKQQTGECEIAEVACANGPGVLYCSARSAKHFRVEATSDLHAKDFDDSHFCQNLIEPPHGCQGSVVSYQPLEVHQQGDENDGQEHTSVERQALSWLLYSHPTSHDTRVDLGIYLNKSPLVSTGWGQPWILNKGPSAYSDLAVCQGSHTFGCLFECGDNCYYEKISFRSFKVEELMENISKS
ncbi:sialidase-3 [Hyperolius riggenbachi]|uniref:sialidase-3 n=1 Tax=Hyperolius riggenbachi TaxID=752182 RepID=UPI0035A26D54